MELDNLTIDELYELNELTHGEDFEDDGEDINIDELVDMIIDEYETQVSELQHAGVKGMKWGVRKKIADKVKDFRTKQAAKKVVKADKMYNRSKDKSVYKKLYANNLKKYQTPEKAKMATYKDVGKLQARSMRQSMVYGALLSQMRNRNMTESVGSQLLAKHYASKMF